MTTVNSTYFLRKWEDLPEFMRTDDVKPYWESLSRKKWQLFIKRLSDVILSVIMIILLAIPMVIIAICVKIDSPGPAFFRQERVTSYGKRFRIHKFRTMVDNAQTIGSAVTVKDDGRITRIGVKLRDLRLDEIPQLFDVLCGDMTFVGTRPEAVKYVERYLPEYYATLLLPAGITSETAIKYKDEDQLLSSAEDVDSVYVEKVLPEKMKTNLMSLTGFSLLTDLTTMFKTVFAVFGIR